MSIKRAIFDTNLLLAFLLSPDPSGSAVSELIEAAARGAFELLLPVDVIAELNTVVARRPTRSQRLSHRRIEGFLRELVAFAILMPPVEDIPPPVFRDPRDDYLAALCVLHNADFLVTRDKGLLASGPVLTVRVVGPFEFLELVRSDFESG